MHGMVDALRRHSELFRCCAYRPKLRHREKDLRLSQRRRFLAPSRHTVASHPFGFHATDSGIATEAYT
jgi:hypothetical protein